MCVDTNKNAINSSSIRKLGAKFPVIAVCSDYAKLNTCVCLMFSNSNELRWLADVHDRANKSAIIPCPINSAVYAALVDVVLEQATPKVSRRSIDIDSKRHFYAARERDGLIIPSSADIYFIVDMKVVSRLHKSLNRLR